MPYLLATIAMGIFVTLQAGFGSESLDGFVEDELRASALPGVAYAWVENGEVAGDAQGVADRGSGTAMSPDMPVPTGSISKSFTAIAILQLVESGEVELDGNLSRYLDVFSGRPAGAITIRQLLGHTSGYSTRQGNDTHQDRTDSDDAMMRQVDRMAEWELAYAPGTQWDYSNANYILLGAVIEAVSGLKYDRYVERRILEPIGMKNSFVGDGAIYPNIAVGHTPWFGGKRPVKGSKSSRVIAPAGGVVASANDLALYLAMLLNGTDDIISAQSKSLMMQPASAQSPYYGLGWMLNPQDGTVYHTGISPGVETLALLVPSERKAVVVLVNAGSGMGFGETGNLLNGISAHALGRDYVPDQSSLGRKSLFLMFAVLPLLFLVGTVQAWLRRSGLRAKSGVSGAFSLWFPLLMTLVLAWVCLFLLPNLFGVSLSTLGIFSPDLAIVLLATAVTGLIWAVFRLGLFYGPLGRI
ncbi:MAG: serine hydrolase domain-containing protein [Pseudomonadota bacterium]